MKCNAKQFLAGRLALAAQVALFWFVAAPSALAAIIVHDTFTYPDGNLVGKTPEVGGIWTRHADTVPIKVISGQAFINHPTGSEDAHTNFATGPIGAGDTVFANFQLTVPAQSDPVTDGYFVHFKPAGNNFGSRVWITASSPTGGYRLGITGDASLETATDLFPANLTFGTTYCIVTSYDYNTGSSKLWVNPTSEASLSVASNDSGAGIAFESFAIRQTNSSTTQYIDNLRVATEFISCSSVPELSSSCIWIVIMLSRAGRRDGPR